MQMFSTSMQIEIQQYINRKKELYSIFINYLENEDTTINDLGSLKEKMNNKEEIYHFIQLIANFFNFHNRNPDIIKKN